SATRVALKVDEDALLAVGRAHHCGEGFRRPASDCIGDLAGGAMHLLPAELRSDRHDDVQTLAARCLDEGNQSLSLEHAANMDGCFDNLPPAYALAGIEVEDDAVRLFEMLAVRAPGVELDHPELGEGEIALGILDGEIGSIL